MANKINNIWIPGIYNIESLKAGEFVKIIVNGEAGLAVWQVAGYCRINRAYEIESMNDISVSRFLKKGKQVYAGFTY